MACNNVSEQGVVYTAAQNNGLDAVIISVQCFLFSQDGATGLVNGTYQYNPTAIAAGDTVVLVDKPATETATIQSSNSFNVQFETVCALIDMHACA